MGAIAEVRVTVSGKPAKLRVQLLGSNAEQDDDEDGYLYYSFPDELREIIRRSEIFADRKSTRLNSSHANISYAVFCLKKKSWRSRQSFDQPETRAALMGFPATQRSSRMKTGS